MFKDFPAQKYTLCLRIFLKKSDLLERHTPRMPYTATTPPPPPPGRWASLKRSWILWLQSAFFSMTVAFPLSACRMWISDLFRRVLMACLFLFADVGLGCLGGGESLCDLESDVVNCCLIEDSEFWVSTCWMTSQKGIFLGSDDKVKTKSHYFVFNCGLVLCFAQVDYCIIVRRQRLLNFLICLALVEWKAFCAVLYTCWRN